MTPSEKGSLEILFSKLERENAASEPIHLRQLRLLFDRLNDLDLWSYGFRYVIHRIESLCSVFPESIQSTIALEVHRILEVHVEKWFSMGNDSVYHVLDITDGIGYDKKTKILQPCNRDWIRDRQDRFLPAVLLGYHETLRVGNLNVSVKMEQLFPELQQAYQDWYAQSQSKKPKAEYV